jgi:hypothetical protein
MPLLESGKDDAPERPRNAADYMPWLSNTFLHGLLSSALLLLQTLRNGEVVG